MPESGVWTEDGKHEVKSFEAELYRSVSKVRVQVVA